MSDYPSLILPNWQRQLFLLFLEKTLNQFGKPSFVKKIFEIKTWLITFFPSIGCFKVITEYMYIFLKILTSILAEEMLAAFSHAKLVIH